MYKVQTRVRSNDADLKKFLDDLDTDGYDVITVSISHQQQYTFDAVIVAKKRYVKEHLGPG